MKNINKIIDLIIKELFKVEDLDESKQRIVMELLKSGIGPEEIDNAFHFIIKKIQENSKNQNTIKKIRILTNHERSRLSDDAHNYLYHYYYNETINWREMEEVISSIEKMERVVDVNELNGIIEKIIFAKNFDLIRTNSPSIN